VSAVGTDDEQVIAEANALEDEERMPDDERSIEDIARDGLEEEEGGQLAIAGTQTGLTNNAGGRRPDHSEAKIRSIRLPVSGQFVKGERLRFVVDVQVSQVNSVDKDEKGRVVRTVREHVFRPVAITAVPIE
jgi:hypothetical protein